MDGPLITSRMKKQTLDSVHAKNVVREVHFM